MIRLSWHKLCAHLTRNLNVVLLIGAAAIPTIMFVRSVSGAHGNELPSSATQKRTMQHAFGKIPVSFVKNQGQTDPSVSYVAQGNHYAFFLTQSGVALTLKKKEKAATSDIPVKTSNEAKNEQSANEVAVKLQFLGANPQARIEGAQPTESKVNYFHGKDPSGWRTGLNSYRQVVYRDLWTGVDLQVREKDGTLKYEFHVKPGGRPQDIRLSYRGVNGVTIDRDGGLSINTPVGALHDDAPVSFQEICGVHTLVESHYALGGKSGDYGFNVGPQYRPDSELVIDPGIEFSTFLGGSNEDDVTGMVVDSAGNTYIVGQTQSTDFPISAGAIQQTLKTPPDVFVTKLNPTGTAVIYSTYLGGDPTPLPPTGVSDDFEFGRGIAVDAAGSVYITGQTTSSNFPITPGAFDTTIHANTNDATDVFVSKLSPDGSQLVYSTFLGGSDIDDSASIAVDSSGAAYVTGTTDSNDFPATSGAFQTTFPSTLGESAYLTKLNATGSELVYSTYLGGSNANLGARVVVDSSNNAYILGSTDSPDFPVTSGAFETTLSGDATFLLKMNSEGSGLIYSTFLNEGGGGDLLVDGSGNAYISGSTSSPNFPTTPGVIQPSATFDTFSSTGFIMKLNPSGSGLVFSTFFGGSPSAGLGVGLGNMALTPEGNIWITGGTNSSTYPVTHDAFQPFYHAGPALQTADGVIAELNADASALIYSTYFGGFDSDLITGMGLDSSGNVYIAGQTISSDFPVTADVIGPVYKGNGDGFVAKLALNGAPPPPPPTPTVSSVVATPAPVLGAQHPLPTAGSSIFINVLLTGGAPAGGAEISLSSSNSTALSVPSTLTLAPGAEYGTVTAVGGTVIANTNVTVTATYNNSQVTSNVVTITPLPTLSSVSIFPTSVVGTSGGLITVVNATVALTGPAPVGGFTATISSSNPAIAPVPATITVPPEATSTNIGIQVAPVTATTMVTISATAGGITKQAVFTDNPPTATQNDTLTVNARGAKGDFVLSLPSGIEVQTGGSDTASFPDGAIITLEVTDGLNAVWSGDCSSGGKQTPSCTFTISGNSTVDAKVQRPHKKVVGAP